jgi:competence protein ComGC
MYTSGHTWASLCGRRYESECGYSYIELLVSLGIITVLLALLMPVIGKSRASAQSISCLSQLRQIGAGFLQYAADNDKRLPNPYELQTSWEQLLRRYVSSAEAFHCPGDSELYPMIGSSYDWRDTGSPETTLAGRRISDSRRGECVLAFEALPAWHAKGRMNAALLNGAALSMDQEECMADLQTPIRLLPDEPPGKPAPKWPPTAGSP